jgi:hypothetical protein
MGNFLLWNEHLFQCCATSNVPRSCEATFESQTYYKPPSYHGLRINLLKQSKVNVSKQITKDT